MKFKIIVAIIGVIGWLSIFCSGSYAAGPIPNTFATLPAGNVVASTLDSNFTFLNNSTPVSVANYAGVDQTGTTDSSAGINNALASGVKNIFIPDGTYKILHALQIPSSVHFYGNSKTGVVFNVAASGIDGIDLASAGNYNNKLENFTIACSAGAARGVVSDTATTSAHLQLSNIAISGCSGDNIYLNNMQYAEIKDIYSSDALNGLHIVSGGNNEVQGGLYYSNSGSSIYLYKTSINRFLNVKLYNESGITSLDLLHVDSSYDNSFVGLYFEPQSGSNVTNNITLSHTATGNNCTDNTFTDNSFVGVSNTATNSIVEIGRSGSCYNTQIKGARFLKQTGINSILLSSQSNTLIEDSVDMATYDTPNYAQASVTPDGNPYVVHELVYPYTGVITPSIVTSGTALTYVENAATACQFTMTRERVYVDCYLQLNSASGGTGASYIVFTGLPAMPATPSARTAVFAVGANNLGVTNGYQIMAQVTANQNNASLSTQYGATNTGLAASLWTAGSYISISGSYPIR